MSSVWPCGRLADWPIGPLADWPIGPVAAWERSHLLHGLDLGAQHAGAPVPEHVAHDVDLLAPQDFAQLLLVEPGLSRAHGAHPGDPGVQVGCRLGLQAGAVLEQRPAHPLGGLDRALLDAAQLVQGRVGTPDDVDLSNVMRAMRKSRLTPWMKAGDTSMFRVSICSGGHPGSLRWAASFLIVLASRPWVTNSTPRLAASAASAARLT